MRQTKEQLLTDLVAANEANKAWKEDDESRRDKFSELLGSFTEIHRPSLINYGASERKVVRLSWLEIAFKMGELKADADYQMCLEREKRLREELSLATERIQKLLNEKKS